MRLKFGPPSGKSGGWPVFDKDGKRIRDEEPPAKPVRAPRKSAAK